MIRSRHSVVLLLGAWAWTVHADDPAPRHVDQVERATVRLAILDAVVIDDKGRPVADLTRDDFEVVAAGGPRAVDTFDIDCRPFGSSATPADAGAVEPRRLVLAVDYQHIHPDLVYPTLDQVKRFVRDRRAADEQVMVVALTGGLRVEQSFTRDLEQVARTIQRMQHDVSLWNGRFVHRSEQGFVETMTTLLDVLGTISAPKSIVLFSGMQDVPFDLEFAQIAGAAAVARTAIYPVDILGLPDDLALKRYRHAPGCG